MPEGLQVRGTAGGRTVLIKDATRKPTQGARYHVSLSLQGETLRCTIDRKLLKAIAFPGSNNIEGIVAIRTQGLAIALDDIMIREGK